MARENEVSNQLRELTTNHDNLKKSYNDLKIRLHEQDINSRTTIESLQKQLPGAAASAQPNPGLEAQFKELKVKYEKVKYAYIVSAYSHAVHLPSGTFYSLKGGK